MDFLYENVLAIPFFDKICRREKPAFMPFEGGARPGKSAAYNAIHSKTIAYKQ